MKKKRDVKKRELKLTVFKNIGTVSVFEKDTNFVRNPEHQIRDRITKALALARLEYGPGEYVIKYNDFGNVDVEGSYAD